MDKTADKQFDVVVIGAGFSGLMCAALLGKHGFRVGVLEQQKHVGGNLQSFERGGKVFNTGLHYVGALEKGQVLHKLFKYLGVIDRVDFVSLDRACFDRIGMGKEWYCSVSGFEGFQAELERRFPSEREAVVNYVREIRAVWDSNPFLNLREVSGVTDQAPSAFTDRGLMEVLDGLTQNEELKAVWLSNNGLYAGDPRRTPFYVHALISCVFIQSAWQIRGGSIKLANALVQIIEEQQGTVVTNCKVAHIKMEDGRARYAQTSEGQRFFAEDFIAAIHPSVALDFFESGVFRAPFVRRLKSLPNTIGSFVVYASLKPGEFRHLNSNVFYSRTRDVWGAVYQKEDWPKSLMMYTTEDPDCPGFAESATIISFMHYEEVAQWETPGSAYNTNSEYKDFKQKKGEGLLDLAAMAFSDLPAAIDDWFASSPLTYRYFTGIPEGSMYGIAKDYKNGIGSYMPSVTRVPNFFLSGQSIGIHGVMGVAMNALLACANKVDVNLLLSEIRKEE
ncbi:phytoene desaturase family protein [Geofilum rhodophaeum]|uniref:phytoene desaturase family protein n=1 Tax=Geofilum rhodophaeum TaxID=1965019 RepID=UPI000B525A1E|nr:NAD(P)/FAD-dependent oxidoreductase [Geofilum rhodophaeum]